MLACLIGAACNSPSPHGTVPAASTPAEPTQPQAASPPPSSVSPTEPRPNPQQEASRGIATLGSLAAGSTVEVTARFYGWNGPCQGDPPTRSAWQLADSPASEAACVYVDGPMPAGLRPAGDSGTAVVVRGVLREAAGLRYLEASTARVAP